MHFVMEQGKKPVHLENYHSSITPLADVKIKMKLSGHCNDRVNNDYFLVYWGMRDANFCFCASFENAKDILGVKEFV